MHTKLLVSLHCSNSSANMEIFDLSKKGHMRKVYSFEEVLGSKIGFRCASVILLLDAGWGDVAYNMRRGILGGIPIGGRIAYHLFLVDENASRTDEIAKLCRKSKWHYQYRNASSICWWLSVSLSSLLGNSIASFDFDPNGDVIATIDEFGVCLISDVNTHKSKFHLSMSEEQGSFV